MDTIQQVKSRDIALEEFGLEAEKISANASAMLQVIKHAASEPSERGWGKLLGYFDPDTKALIVEKSYPLILPRPDEKMRKEDNTDELLKKKISEFSYNYRQVGFYIFSEDDDIFTFNILNYLINNEKFGNIKTFLHFSVLKAKANQNPFSFYEVSDVFNKALFGQTMENNKIVFDVKEDLITSLDVKADKMYKSIPFEIIRSLVFEATLSKCDANLTNLLDKKQTSGQRSELLTKNLHELINRQAFLIHNHMQNKKIMKQSTTINLYGGYLRAESILKNKRDVLDHMSTALDNVGKLINE